MSAKYRRVKQADLALPAPLRWLTRAFSSITLAVILLLGVCVYSVLGTVPLYFLTIAGLYAAAIVGTVGPASLLAFGVIRLRLPIFVKLIVSIALLVTGSVLAWWLCEGAYHWAYNNDWLTAHRALVVYRLPALEMTTQEWFGWWPMQLMLVLFTINMIWATIRRIEFKFVNIGVLTVHSGIVVIALGSILYGHFKVEGDTILWRQDLGGGWENVFYDASAPALYVTTENAELMLSLPELPRYNDYEIGELSIDLHDRPALRQQLGEHVRLTIPGFVAYGELTPRWQPIDEVGDRQPTQTSPALALRVGSGEGAPAVQLLGDVPAERVAHFPGWSIEYLIDPTEQRVRDLQSNFEGPHGLVVEVPEQDFRQVYAIEPGQTIEVGDTGYTLTVEQIGPYDMPFISEGYQGATDTRALVRVNGNGKAFRRIAMHRYPERSQDFTPSPESPEGAPANPNVGPMGQRSDPDPAIHLAYLDHSQAQYHLVAESPDDPSPAVIVRLPGAAPMYAKLPDGRVPVPSPGTETGSNQHWATVVEHLPRVARVLEPAPTPKAQRRAEDEGHYIQSLLPVRIEVDLPEGRDETSGGASGGGGDTWSRLVWLHHMRYPKYPDQTHRPVTVDVPTVGEVKIAFSRQRYQLPFAMALEDFKMTPYEGSTIPRDFESEVFIADVDEHGMIRQQPETYRTHLNNPIVYHPAHAPLQLNRVKISQNGWDPPQEGDPNAQARNEQGRFINQQRFTVLGIGNNVGVRIIAVGSIMVVVGIPWAFYIKPLLVRWQKRRIQEQLAREGRLPQKPTAQPTPKKDAEQPIPTGT